MLKSLENLKTWLMKGLEFTIGDPSSNKGMPPEIGPQPYKEKPIKMH